MLLPVVAAIGGLYFLQSLREFLGELGRGWVYHVIRGDTFLFFTSSDSVETGDVGLG